MPDIQEPISSPEPIGEAFPGENAFLLKKSLQKILTFVSTMTIALLIVILRQGEKLFLFNLESNNMNDAPFFLFFRIVLFGFLIYLLGYLMYFWNEVEKRKKMSAEAQTTALPAFRKRYNLFDLWTVVPVFLLGLVVVSGFFYSPAIVEGSSMETTFSNGDTVLIDHFTTNFEAGDVVIVDHGTELLIKRLIAVPGDHLRIDATGVYLNGSSEPIEDYVPMYYDSESDTVVPYFTYDGIIPEGQYFVMGDNRNNSLDGRVFGLVDADQMLGIVVLPPNE